MEISVTSIGDKVIDDNSDVICCTDSKWKKCQISVKG